MNDADSAASTRSPVTAMENPAPAATPLTAVIRTASMRANVEIARCRSSATPLMKRPRLGADAKDLRSPPAQKNRPDPVSTTTFVASVSQRMAASASSRVMVSFMPFAASGRLRVIRAIGARLLELDGLVFGHTGTLSGPSSGGGSPPYGTLSLSIKRSRRLTTKVKMAPSTPGTSSYKEVERKFEVVESTVSPSFDGLSSVARVERSPAQQLDAVYFDTPGRDLAAHKVTFRRRTGGRRRRMAPQAARRTGRAHRGAGTAR